MLALGAPGRLWVTGEGPTLPALVQTIYTKARGTRNLTVVAASDDAEVQAARWVLAR